MQTYEYKVVPAPVRGEKAKGVKGTEARFAHTLTQVINELAADGWEYQRAETLPCEERTGLTRSLTVLTLNLLVFRRPVAAPAATTAPATTVAQDAPAVGPAPTAAAPVEPPAPPRYPLPPVVPAPGIAPSPVPPLRAVPPEPGFRATPPAPGAVDGPRRLDPFAGGRDRG